ncbi:MAG: choice-of-anchor D domain-containing protein [Verrucomicrobiaceae bacterium]|nr:choice-of-anchor D domain-containing protein [Verrucomicrobiaceae bacterium]
MKKLVFLSLAIVLHTFSTGVEAADGALAFTPASQQYVEVPNFHTLGVTNEVTIEFWAFTNAAGNHSAFILEADAGGNRCQMHTAYSNGQTFWDFGSIVGNAGRLQVATPSGTVGAWTHWAVVASASGSFMKIYRDGVEVATKTGMDDFSTSTARSLRIGGNTGLFFDGQLDEFRVWNVARTASEIAANRHVPLTGSEAGLRLFLKLDETSGTTAVNSATATGAAYDGTLVNAPVRSTRPVLVTTLANELDTPSGADLSLREALRDAAAAAGADSISFAPALAGGTITLSAGIAVNNSAGVTVDATSLPGGITIDAGAGTNRVFNIASGGVITLNGLTLTGGSTAGSDDGGAIHNQGTLTMSRCTLTGNAASDEGGAIHNTSTLSMSQCTLSGNTSGRNGGAIMSIPGTVTLTQCTIAGNTATNSGGGVSIFGSTVSLTNCLIAGNTAPSGPDLNGSTYTRSGVNLIGKNANVTTPFPSGQPNANGDFVGTNAAPLSPQLDVLGSYGGPTQTRRLLAGSPALNRIASPAFTTDQRGFPIVGAADIGAYESQVGAIAALAINEDATTGTLPFSVGTVGTLTATSSNTALVPNASITLGGSGSSRTLAATPLADANGTTTITVTDSPSGEAASFTLTVTAVNDTPTLNAISNPAAINEDAPQQTVSLSGIGTGAANETQTLTVTATSSNTALIPHPTVSYTSPNTTGSLAYTPVANASGSAIITVTVNDGQAANNTRVRTFTVVVNAVNDAPVAVADAQTIAPKTTLKFAATKLVANDTDLEGGTLTVVSVQSPSHGATVSLGSGTITYVPAAEFTGVATFTYTVTDGTGGFAVGLVTITVSSTEKVVLKDTQMSITSAGTITNAVELDGTGGLTSDQPVTLGGQVTVKGTPVIDTSSNITISGSIDGDGRLEKTGSGRLNLTAASTFTGGFRATQGVVGIGDNAALGTGTVTLGGAGIESVGARRVLANPVEITGNTVVSGPGIGLSGPVKLRGPRGIQTDGNLDIDGPVQDEGGPAKITKRGGGDLILGGENTFSGGVDVKEGTLALAKDTAAGTGPVVLSGGELEAIGDRELDNPVELKADTVLKGDEIKLMGPMAVSGEKTLTTEADVELHGTVKSNTPGTTTKLKKKGKGKLTNAPTAKNDVDVEVNDGRYANEGVSRGSTTAPSPPPQVQVDTGLFSSHTTVSGFPAVSYFDKENGDLKYMRAKKEDGRSFLPPVTVDATGDVGASTSLFVVDGHPAIAYREGGGVGGRLKYVRANDMWGQAWGTPVVVSELKSSFITLQVVDGKPAIAFFATEEKDLCFVRARDVTGTNWGTVLTVASSGNVGFHASMVIANEKPAILCLDLTNNSLVYFRATTENGSSWAAGVVVSASSNKKGILSANSHPRLSIVSGRPAVCYVAKIKATPQATAVPTLLYKRANNMTGLSWPHAAVTVISPGEAMEFPSLTEVGGTPAVSYLKAVDSKTNLLEYVWAADANGDSWPATNLRETKEKARSSATSLQPLSGGRVGISYYSGSSTLGYASFQPVAETVPTTPDDRVGDRADRKQEKTPPPDPTPVPPNPDTGGKNGQTKPVKDQGSGSNAPPPAADPARPPEAGQSPKVQPAQSGGYVSGDSSNKAAEDKKGSAEVANGNSPGMSENAEDVIWEDGVTIVWDINDASGLPGLNWDYFKVGGLFEIEAASTDPIYFEIESLLPDNTAGPVTHFSPYVAQSWKIVSAGAITGFAADKFVISTEGFANDLKGGGFSLAQSGGELHLVFTPASTLAPEITVLSSSVSLGSGSALDVGTLAASTQTTLSYTVRNDGSGPLSGIRIENASVLIGDGSLTFDVPAATTLAPGASLIFDATLTNEGAAAGGIVAAFTITSDDADESIFTLHLTANAAVVPAPEIAVAKTAGNVDLTSGSLTPVNFGNVSTAASAALDFTLANTGSASLSGIDFIIDGPHSIDFHLIAENLSDVDGGASASFQVEFEPSAAGLRQATLFIRSSDADENPFIIHLSGTGDATPEIAVTGAGRSLVDGDPSPVDFGTLAVNAHQDISFSIANIGTLDLTGLALSLTGADASQFSIQTGLTASTLAPADAAPVVIRFAPTSAGVKHANLQITSTDSDEPVFDIALTGEGSVATEFVLENAAAASLSLNESADFGTVLSGESAALTFTIKNIGSADLTGLTLSLSGDAAADYSLGALSTPAPLAGPSGVSTFTLTFSPSASGIRNAALLIESNDADEGLFVIYLTGTGTLPPSAPTDILLSNSTVIENAGPGTLIGTLTAVDANLGQSHTFTLVPGTGDTHNTLFGISSGDLVLNANADFESLTTYSIRVQADDGSGGTFAKTFSITVTDANDAPLITSSLGGSSAAISVAENTTAVTTVTASDLDSPAQTLLHSITGGADAAHFTIVPATGVLTFLTAPSFEAPSDLGADNIYEVLITVTDSGTPALSDTQLISITITDAPEPEIAISGNATPILAGDVSHFGDTAVTGGSVVRIFTITNSGLAALTLTGTAPDYVTLSGSGAGHFSITAQPASGTLAAGGTQTFQITFDPSALGTHTATVSIASDDEDENLFTFDIRGNGASSHFTAAVSNWAAANNLAPGDSNPGDDPDGDGKTNLEEFAFGTHPGTGSSGSAAAAYTGSFAAATLTATGQPLAQFEPSSVTGVDFRAVFVRRADHSTLGLTYTVQFSADMTTWQTTTVIPTVLDTVGDMQLVSVPYPLFVKGKRARFFHVVVSQP